jgi:hypothetical protein
MHLISCTDCGVVLDAEMLPFPRDIFSSETGEIDMDKAFWTGREYVPKVQCPVCKGDIPKEF